MKFKLIGLVVALIVVAGLVAVAAHATGAYFSDTHNGKITGTIGDISIKTGGGVDTNSNGDFLGFNWDEMLPGVPYSATMTVQNTSSSNSEDIWLTFPNATALSALNTLGTYGAVQILVDGNQVYENHNLNDIPNNGTTGLPAAVQVGWNVGPTASHTITFKFEYASKMSAQEPGGVFNQYPITLAMTGKAQDPRYATGYGQLTVNTGDGNGNGLPFAIVATEPGIAPGTTGTTFSASPF
jgi:hypothetical protein